MDGNNWRATQAEPNLVYAADWRTQLQSEFREGIVNNIMDNLKRHLPISGPEGLLEIEKIAVRFEEKIYHASPSQVDYLRKISMKMLTLETKSNTGVAKALLPNSVVDMATQSQVRWTDQMDEVLTAALIEDVTLRGKKAKNGLKPATYTIVAEKVTQECGVQINVLHVKNRLKPMKKQYLLARAAINSNGFGIQWDGDNKWLDVEKSSWIKYCKDKSKKVKSLRRKFFPLYDALWLIFGDEGAGRDIAFGIDPSVIESPSVNTESHVGHGDDEEDLGNNMEGASVDPKPTYTQAQSSRGQRKKRKRKDLLVAAIESNGVQIGRVADAMEILVNGRTSELWEVLTKIEGISFEMKVKVMAFFSKEERLLAGFLSIPDEFKEQAMNQLIISYNIQ